MDSSTGPTPGHSSDFVDKRRDMGHEAVMFLMGSVSSAVVGYLAIRFLLLFLANHTLRVFAYYRFPLAAVVAVVVLSSAS